MERYKNIKISRLIIVSASCIVFFSARCHCAENFLSSPFGKQLIDAGLYFMTNPGDFLFDLHHDAMDYTPVQSNRFFGVQTNLLLLANPGIVNSISGKLALKEGKILPQFGVFGGYWKTFLLSMLTSSSDSLSADLSGWSAGVFLSKTVNPKTRLFTHVNFSRISLNVTLDPALVLVENVLTISSLNANVYDTYIFTGIEHRTGEYEDKVVVAETGYGVRTNKIVAKILVHSGIIEVGLTIYPEGLLVVHPVLNLHIEF